MREPVGLLLQRPRRVPRGPLGEAMSIDEGAPVVEASEILIAAPPETVWDVLAAIERWPTWNPDVKWASVEGEIAAGTRFRWKTGPGTAARLFRRPLRKTLIRALESGLRHLKAEAERRA